MESVTTRTFSNGTHIFVCCQFLHKLSSICFWVVNAHVEWKTHEEDLIELKSKIDELEGPVFVMGDFNAEPYETWHRKFNEDGFVDCYFAMNKRHAKATFNSGQLHKHVDFIFAKNFVEKNILSSFLGNDQQHPHHPEFLHEALPTQDIPSDHIPLTTVFSLNQT